MPSFAADFLWRFQSSSLADISTDPSEEPNSTNSSDDVSKQQWVELLPKVAQLYSHSLDFMIQQSFPVSSDYYYWERRLNRGTLSILYYGVQTLFILNCFARQTLKAVSQNREMEVYWKEIPGSVYHQTRLSMKKKRNNLRAYRRLQASAIGICVQQGLAGRLRLSVADERRDAMDRDAKEIINQTLLLVYNCLQLLRETDHLPQQTQQQQETNYNQQEYGLHRVNSSAALTLVQTIDRECSRRRLSLEEANVMISDIQTLIEDPQFEPAKQLLADNGRLSLVAEYWLPSIAFGIICVQSARSWFRNRLHLRNTVRQFGAVSRQVFTDWIVEPLWKIWKTVRHEEQLKLMTGAQAVASDLESLERMAVDYATDNNLLKDAELEQLPAKVRDGDFSIILKAYESNLRAPLRNVVAGDMLRLILIQVQKAKVDLGTAMQALDKLLRANQLNFAFLAVLPTLFLLGAAWNTLTRLFQRRRGQSRSRLHRRFNKSLRELEKILLISLGSDGLASPRPGDESNNNNDALSFTDLGRLLIETYLLHQMASSYLPVGGEAREMLMEDLSALESLQVGRQQKLILLQRMQRTCDIYLRGNSFK